MRAGVRLLLIVNPPVQRIGELQSALKTGFVERLLYSIDPRGLQSPTWVSPRIDGRGRPDRARDKMEMVNGGSLSAFDGMRMLADSTGGFAVTGTNSFDRALARIVSENSSYYVIGYYSTNSKTDGSVRKNEVKLVRKGLKALYRASYFAPRS